MRGDRELELHGTLLRVAEQRLDTLHGEFRAVVFRNLVTREVAIALLRGDVEAGGLLLSRVHSSCITSEAFGACDCDCAEQLDAALEAIAAEGRGVLFYLSQEGRGAGLTAKARDRMLVQASRERLSTFEAYERLGLAPDQRRYAEVATMCRMLSIEAPLELLTNNPDKVSFIEREKVRVSATRPLQRATSPFNRHYLEAKQRSGHSLDDLEGDGTRAQWPEPVLWFDPERLPEHNSIVYSASYWLPVRTDKDSAWFRLHLYGDLGNSLGARSGWERVVLCYGEPEGDDPLLLRVQPEHLLDRFPLRGPSSRERWAETVRRFVANGSGAAVFLPSRLMASESPAEEVAAPEELDWVSLLLLAHHARGRSCRLVCDAETGPHEEAAAGGLRRAGVKLAPSARLTV